MGLYKEDPADRCFCWTLALFFVFCPWGFERLRGGGREHIQKKKKAWHVRVLAILPPTNHATCPDYIRVVSSHDNTLPSPAKSRPSLTLCRIRDGMNVAFIGKNPLCWVYSCFYFRGFGQPVYFSRVSLGVRTDQVAGKRLTVELAMVRGPELGSWSEVILFHCFNWAPSMCDRRSWCRQTSKILTF
jgi:hypothetical protein